MREKRIALAVCLVLLLISFVWLIRFPVPASALDSQVLTVKKAELLTLPMWEGDKIFLRLLDSDEPFFSLKLCYAGDRLESAVLNGKQVEL